MGLDWYGVALLLILMVGGALVAQQFGLIPTGSAPGTDINVTVGAGDWDSDWNTTVLAVINGYSGLAWREAWNTTVEQIAAGNLTWQNAWNATVEQIMENSSLTWKSLWDTTVNALINAYNITWNNSWNTTVTEIVNSGSINWHGAWNATVQDIVLNHAFSTLNATNLFTNYLYLGNLTSDPGAPVAGQMWYRSDLDTLHFYNGTGIVVIPSIGGGSVNGTYILSPSYTIYKSGTTYYAQDDDGTTDYSGATFATVFNNARGALSTLATGASGQIFLKKATYSLDSGITIGKKTQVIAESGTVLDVTANLATGAIIIDPTTSVEGSWRLENFEIDLNSHDGDGVYSTHSGTTSANAVLPVMRNLYIHDVKAGYACVNLTNFMNTEFSNLRLRSAGTGMRLSQDTSSESEYFGNSVFSMIRIGITAANGVGLDLTTTAGSTYAPIFLTFTGLHVISGNYDGTIGVRIRGVRECSFTKTYIEQVATGIDIGEAAGGQHAYDINWYSTTVRIGSGTVRTAIYTHDDAYMIRYFGGLISSPGLLLNHTSDIYNAGENFYGVAFEGGGTMSITGDKAVTFFDCTGYTTEEWGSTSTADNAEAITHTLDGTPDYVLVTSGNSTANIICAAYGFDTNHFHVSLHDDAGNAVTGQKIYWHAYYKP